MGKIMPDALVESFLKPPADGTASCGLQGAQPGWWLGTEQARLICIAKRPGSEQAQIRSKIRAALLGSGGLLQAKRDEDVIQNVSGTLRRCI